MATQVDGDLLQCDAEMIVHQGNCASTRCRGICESIFTNIPIRMFTKIDHLCRLTKRN